MAEFTEVMRQVKRMCEEERPCGACGVGIGDRTVSDCSD